MSVDRLSAVWAALLNAFLGRKAIKTIDACALYWGIVVKVAGAKLDVKLDSTDIASPSGAPLLVGMSGALTLTGGERVLVGFRNGDPSQPYVFGLEQGTSAQEATIAATKLYLGAKTGAKTVALSPPTDANFSALYNLLNGVFGAMSTPLVTPAPGAPDVVYVAVKAALAAAVISTALPPTSTAAINTEAK